MITEYMGLYGSLKDFPYDWDVLMPQDVSDIRAQIKSSNTVEPPIPTYAYEFGQPTARYKYENPTISPAMPALAMPALAIIATISAPELVSPAIPTTASPELVSLAPPESKDHANQLIQQTAFDSHTNVPAMPLPSLVSVSQWAFGFHTGMETGPAGHAIKSWLHKGTNGWTLPRLGIG